jgi:hypothetical protein
LHSTHLLLLREEELVRVDTVRNGTADDREQVKNDRRLIGVFEQQLLQDVEKDGEEEKGGEAGGSNSGGRRLGGEVAHRSCNISEKPHLDRKLTEGMQEA